MKHLLIFTVFLILSLGTINACDCGYGGNFIKLQAETRLVVLIKVTRYLTFISTNTKTFPASMEAEVINTYKGSETAIKLTILGDAGYQCLESIQRFQVGQYYVLALNAEKKSHLRKAGKKREYSISSCGCYWLSADIINHTVAGDINSIDRTPSTMSLEQLNSEIKKHRN